MSYLHKHGSVTPTHNMDLSSKAPFPSSSKPVVSRSLPSSPNVNGCSPGLLHQMLQNHMGSTSNKITDGMVTATASTGNATSSSSVNGGQQPVSNTSRRARSNNFTVTETFDLLDIWTEILGQTNYCPRNFHEWENVSTRMKKFGYERTALQCKNRIQNLTSSYCRIQKSEQDARSFSFPYYEKLSHVLIEKKSVDNEIPSLNGSYTTPSGSLTISPIKNKISVGSNFVSPPKYLNHTFRTQGTANEMFLKGKPGLSLIPLDITAQTTITEVKSSSSNSAPIAHCSSNQNSNTVQASSPFSIKVNDTRPDLGAATVKVEPEDLSVNSEQIQKNINREIPTMDGFMDPHHPKDHDFELRGVRSNQKRQRVKRKLSSAYSSVNSETTMFNKNSEAHSARDNSNAATSTMDQYLSELVDIERQWLAMETNRAENKRQTMSTMVRILQAIIGEPLSADEQDMENHSFNHHN